MSKAPDDVSEIEVGSLLSEVRTPAASERSAAHASASPDSKKDYRPPTHQSESVKSSQLLARSPESLKYTTEKEYKDDLPVKTNAFYDIKKTLGIRGERTEKDVIKGQLKAGYKLTEQLKKQKDDYFLKQSCLPPIPIGAPQPKIINVSQGKSTFVASNDTHIKSTNNGFSRNSLGGFFAH